MRFNLSTIRDRLNTFKSPDLREPAFRIINELQREDPEVQIMSTAAALMAFAEAVNMNPHDLVQKIERAKRNIDAPFTKHYRAIVEYAKGEFK